jgi:phosphohistidine phosphatase
MIMLGRQGLLSVVLVVGLFAVMSAVVDSTAYADEVVRLYLVQHADRVSKDVDPEKPLSKKGVRDIKRVSKAVSKLDLNVDEIRYSTQLRAKQTAIYLSKAKSLKGVPLTQVENLEWNSDIKGLANEMSRADSTVLLAGHMPHLGQLASFLLTGDKGGDLVVFKKGGIVCLQRSADNKWRVEWILTPPIAP